MAETLIRAWWARLRGLLQPRPCPYSLAWALDLPMRRWRASPERILEAFGVDSGERVLEIGPGTGFYTRHAARLVGANGRLICVDIQIGMLRELRRRLLQDDQRSVATLWGDARHLPLRTGSIDHVFLVTVLGEIPDRAGALQEIRRVLRPAGRLSVCEQLPDPDYVRPRTLREQLTSAGFIELCTRGRWVYAATYRRADSSEGAG